MISISARLRNATASSARINPRFHLSSIRLTEASVNRGTFGSPTLFVGEEIFFGKDKLRDAIEAARPRQPGDDGERTRLP
jgi:2-hydroxychromene-2-carboxylate isomerase